MLIFKVFFILKYLKIIFFLFLKKLFLILVYQNDIKILKNNNENTFQCFHMKKNTGDISA
jgi:hypothetical protein